MATSKFRANAFTLMPCLYVEILRGRLGDTLKLGIVGAKLAGSGRTPDVSSEAEGAQRWVRGRGIFTCEYPLEERRRVPVGRGDD